MRTYLISCLALIFCWSALAGEVKLPPPATNGGMPLMDALRTRSTTRSFAEKALSDQDMSDLLWAAFGVNRPESGKRTAPSSYNWQDVILYVFLESGVYTYDANSHALVPVKEGDHRAKAGLQGFVATAPLSIVYVTDFATMVMGDSEFSDEYKLMVGCIDAGHISQNVYLFCSSRGLGAVARGSVDREALAAFLDLPDNKKVLFGQTVGYVE